MLILILALFKDNKLALPLVLFFLLVFYLEIRARLSNTCDQSENM